MANCEEEKHLKPEKSSPPPTDQNNVHVYPDWAAMQAYYGPRLAVPPYMNSAVASPQGPPHYMWAPPQSMMPPYGNPYAAFYAHGGVYAHPGVPIPGTPMSMDTPTKSSGNTDGGFVKKLKEFDGLAISIGNGNGNSTERGTELKLSESEETTDGSSDGSNRVTVGGGQNGKKRSRQGSPDSGDVKAQKTNSLIPTVEVSRASEKTIDVITPANNALVKTMEKNTKAEFELKDSSEVNVKHDTNNVPSLPNDTWIQNDRELKREKRKQSNRESARRSRLRKQAEAEELATKVHALNSENMSLKSEINKLMESSEKLKIENVKLMEKLKDAQTNEVNLHKIDDSRLKKPVSTVNLLARVNNNNSENSTDKRNNNNDDGDSYENRNPGAKLRQLLDSNPRTDAVVAG